VPGEALIRELSREQFLADLDALLAIYAAAMRPEPAHLPGRLSIMERHAGHPGFRALVVTVPPSPQAVAFSYGFRGTPGQWWHDVVRAGVTAASGAIEATRWLADPLEVAEVHVRPEHQRRGIGRDMLLTLTAGRDERTAVLSTQDDNATARSLYHRLGFTDLLRGFSFPGGGPPYAVMGAVLPLRLAPRPSNS
jgi:ribosomal protein S18 acetylase RimI-like enzyme